MNRAQGGRPPTSSAPTAGALLVALATGCATAAPRPVSTAHECTVAATSAAPSIRISLERRIEARNAPVPTSQAERLLFAQLYDTLVRVACDGTPVPALAASWSASQDGMTWSFRLRNGITFADGVPLDATAVAAAFSTARVPALAAVTAAGEHEVHVRLHERQDVSFFAQPALAVTRPAAAGEWRIGTGAYRPESDTRGLRLVLRQPDQNLPDTLHAVHTYEGDPRSALDSGTDLLVTADAATIAYAGLLGGYATRPLPWNRTYALVTYPAVSTVLPSEPERDALARDVAGVGTRAATIASPAWCTPAGGVSETSPRALARIAYARGDDIARSLAERIAALSWPADRAPAWLRARLPADLHEPLTARPVDPDSLPDELRAGRSAVLIMSLAQCSGADPGFAGTVASRLLAVPLVDAHDHLVHRAGVGSITVDAAGTLRFETVR